MKTCRRCLSEKSYSEFHKNKQTKDGYSVYCKPCKSAVDKKWRTASPERVLEGNKRAKAWREANPERYKEQIKKWKKENPDKKWLLDKRSQLWTHYRLTIEQYQKMFDSQDGKCYICKEEKKLVVDHDHNCCDGKLSCGKCVRALICHNCNTLVGFLERNDNLIDKVNQYIKDFE